MLDDLAITPASVSRSSPWVNQSPMVRPSRCSSAGTLIRVRGVTLPASIRALRVSAFSTEPGS